MPKRPPVLEVIRVRSDDSLGIMSHSKYSLYQALQKMFVISDDDDKTSANMALEHMSQSQCFLAFPHPPTTQPFILKSTPHSKASSHAELRCRSVHSLQAWLPDRTARRVLCQKKMPHHPALKMQRSRRQISRQ